MLQLSLHRSLDPALHLAAGTALSCLRDEGVLIIGSGMSCHNMRGFRGGFEKESKAFDDWLTEVVTDQNLLRRDAALARWDQALLSAWAPRLLSVLRITTAFTFLQHGSAKLLGFPKVEMFANLQLASMHGVAGVLELVGGVLLLVGLFSRPVAFILSGLMAAAYFIAHSSPMLNRGEAAYLFCFVFLYLSAAGPGPWSIDAARAKA